MRLKGIILFCLICSNGYGKTCSEIWQKNCSKDKSLKCFNKIKSKLDKKCRERILLMDDLKGNKNSCISQLNKICPGTLDAGKATKCIEDYNKKNKHNKKKIKLSKECHDAIVNTEKRDQDFSKNCDDVLFKKCSKYDISKQPELMKSCFKDAKAHLPKECDPFIKEFTKN